MVVGDTKNTGGAGDTERSEARKKLASLRRDLARLDRKMEVILARLTTELFKEGIGQGMMVSAANQLRGAELTLRLAEDDEYQGLVTDKDNLLEQIDVLDDIIFPDDNDEDEFRWKE